MRLKEHIVKNKNLFIYVVILFILFAGILEAKMTKASIFTIGKISAKISGVDNIPLVAKTSITLTPNEYLLPPSINTFRLKFDFESQNISGIEEECLVKINIEKEVYLGKWVGVGTECKRLTCKPKKLKDKREIITSKIIQDKDEVKYLITISSLFLCGVRSDKSAVITVKRLKESSYIYTTIPYLPLTLLHDPAGDRSYSFISPEYTITHIMNVDLGTVCSFANQSQVELSSPDNEKLIITPSSKDSIKLSYTPIKELTSSKISDNPDLIGPGYGDVYLIAKNIPIKISYLRRHKEEEGLKLLFQIVSQEERGISEGVFDIIELPVACLREPNKDHSIFGTWHKFGISDEFRNELIRLNIGWDNDVSISEKEYLVDIGADRIRFDKKKIERRYEQQVLAPMEFEVMVHIEPQFAKEVQIPNKDGLTNLKLVFNSENLASFDKAICSFAVLDDDDCTEAITGDFFTYHVYLDTLFNTPLFITDKDNSTSSKPHEYWTLHYLGNLIIDVTICSADGKPVKLPYKVIKECIFQLDDIVLKPESPPPGRYKISWLKSQSYNLLVSADGFTKVSKNVEILPNGTTSINIELIPENLILYGCIKDISTNLGIKDAVIEVRENNKLIKTTTTDSLGDYMIVGLPIEATYTMTTIAPEYETKTINIIEVENKIINREIYLDKLKIIATPEVIATPTTTQVIKNPDFSLGLEGWQRYTLASGKVGIKVVKETQQYPHVLELTREVSMKQNGIVGILQPLDINVQDLKSLVIQAEVKILYSSLLSDGTRGGVYPVTIELEYRDESGRLHTLRHGFIYHKKLNYPHIGEIIPHNNWYRYNSGNLLDVLPRVATITNIKVYGAGWDFISKIAKIELYLY